MASSLVLLMRQAQALDDPLPCHRENPQLWFSDHPGDLQLAKEYCQPCPMRLACLAGAVGRHEPHGVWGGEIFACGAIITEKRPRGRPRKTGRVKAVIAGPVRAATSGSTSGQDC
jgi:WhiB family transcriptional regulator, redox-sensing transcriptional regulator